MIKKIQEVSEQQWGRGTDKANKRMEYEEKGKMKAAGRQTHREQVCWSGRNWEKKKRWVSLISLSDYISAVIRWLSSSSNSLLKSPLQTRHFSTTFRLSDLSVGHGGDWCVIYPWRGQTNQGLLLFIWYTNTCRHERAWMHTDTSIHNKTNAHTHRYIFRISKQCLCAAGCIKPASEKSQLTNLTATNKTTCWRREEVKNFCVRENPKLCVAV